MNRTAVRLLRPSRSYGDRVDARDKRGHDGAETVK